MHLLSAGMDWLRRFGASLALCGLLAAGAYFHPGAAPAAPDLSLQQRADEGPALRERAGQPRTAIVRTALAPQPNRPKHHGGFKDKALLEAESGRTVSCTVRIPPPRQPASFSRRACSWTWLSRAPPSAA